MIARKHLAFFKKVHLKLVRISCTNSRLNSAGGFYSTSNDLITLGTAILNKSLLGSWATNKWLKPVSSTSTIGRGMGAPWEILRSTNLVCFQISDENFFQS